MAADAPATATAVPDGATVQPSNIPPTHLANEFLGPNFPTVTHTPKSLRQLVKCGPLLRYIGTDYEAPRPVWRGSVLVVTAPTGPDPVLRYDGREVPGQKIHHERDSVFWRFMLELELTEEERKIQYIIHFGGDLLDRVFWVPRTNQTMRIMFHSCNGFSVGSDEKGFSGPALWNDVLRVHAENPLHCMIGGGDQIYNDGVRVTGPLRPWADMNNPVKRRHAPWTKELEDSVDEWYLRNYEDWYRTRPFAHANSQIPQVNIWDDHDIIDGYGSYTDDFMLSPVFGGVGRVAFKYYMLFQHHTPYTGETVEDSSWIIGKTPGKYCGQLSRSIYSRLGRHVAFLGVDARAERTRHQINLPETYDMLFERCENEIDRAKGDISHLVVLLGVPIAYPRLVWLENILTSPVLGVIRFLNKRFGIANGLFNHFDGEVDILDDLDDHYCAKPHKKERNALMLRFQQLAKSRNVRITFLSGDVHLAAIGRFYAKPSLEIKTEHDFRYMVNIISSAITNKPPPVAVSNILARRNKVHHLDDSTDEQLLDFFDKDVHGEMRPSNQNTMPSRNYCIITESPGAAVDGEPAENGTPKRSGTNAVGEGEIGAGAGHVSAHAGERKGGIRTGRRALNVAIRVEVDRSNQSGETRAYGFSIPELVQST